MIIVSWTKVGGRAKNKGDKHDDNQRFQFNLRRIPKYLSQVLVRLPSPEVEEEGGQEERGEQEDAPSHCGNHVQFDRHLQECICNVQSLPKTEF